MFHSYGRHVLATLKKICTVRLEIIGTMRNDEFLGASIFLSNEINHFFQLPNFFNSANIFVLSDLYIKILLKLVVDN